MSDVYVSRLARPELIEYLLEWGHRPLLVREGGRISGIGPGGGSGGRINRPAGAGASAGREAEPAGRGGGANEAAEAGGVSGGADMPGTDKAAEAESRRSPSISTHADLYFCKLGAEADAPLFSGDPAAVTAGYPSDARYNAVCLDGLFIHNTACTAPPLLEEAAALGLTPVHVNQGYTRCSLLPVDGRAAITGDAGIAKALCRAGAAVLRPQGGAAAAPGFDETVCLPKRREQGRAAGPAAGLALLLVQPGHVLLPGYSSGFLGGASGRITRPGRADEIVFHGDLSAHPDFRAVAAFIRSRGLFVKFFPQFPLTDIGSLLENGGT